MSARVRQTNTLDLYRVIAILMVMTVHCGQYIFPPNTIAYNIIHIGLYGVPVFFALSGYLAMLSAKRKIDAKEYYIGRIIRIAPTYYVCLILTSLLVSMPIDNTGLGWLRYIFFMNLYIPCDNQEWVNINGYWCMPVFVFFYAIVPLLIKYIDTLARYVILCVCVVIACLCMELHFLHEGFNQMGLPVFFDSIPCFLFGGTISFVNDENRLKITILYSLLFIVLISLIPETYILWGLGTSLFILWFNKPINSKFLCKPILFFANISFNLYLVHMMVLRELCNYHLSTKLYVVLFLIITFICATILYYLFDRNISRLLTIIKR